MHNEIYMPASDTGIRRLGFPNRTRVRTLPFVLNGRTTTKGCRSLAASTGRRLFCLLEMLWGWIVIRSLVWFGRLMGWLLIRLFLRVENYILAPIYLALWSKRAKQRFISPTSLTIGLDSLGFEADQRDRLRACLTNNPRVEIGEFDQDGLLLSRFGPIHGMPCVSDAGFVRRNYSTVRLILLGDQVAIEKNYRGARYAFVREITALQRLNAAGYHEHAILDINLKALQVTKPFIKGMVLREELAQAGAVLRDRDVMGHPQFQGLSPRGAVRKRIESGRNLLHKVVTPDFADKLYRIVQDIHTAGVTDLGLKYGNIVIDEISRAPRFVDFGQACSAALYGKFFSNMLRDYDTEQFNLHFGTEHLTYNLIKSRLNQMEPHEAVDLGYGLSLGKPWSARACYRCWLQYINHNVQSLVGKRVLSLGSSNAFPALQLLRLGARQVVVIEPKADLMRQAKFLKEAIEWRDNRRYDVEYVQMDLHAVPTRELGRFDIVVAVSCLDPDVCSTGLMIKHLSTIATVLLFQSPNPDRHGFLQLQHLRRLLEENGFSVRALSAEACNQPSFIVAERPQSGRDLHVDLWPQPDLPSGAELDQAHVG